MITLKNAQLLSVLLSLATWSSCAQTQDEKQAKAGAGDNTCLLGYAEKYDKLLTKELVTEATGADADRMTAAYQQIHKDSKYHDVTYSWNTGRTKKVVGMEVPAPDIVKLTGISAISLSHFQLSYRAVSEEETQALKAKAGEALAGKSDNKRIQERMKKLDELGVSKEEQQKMMESFTNSAQKMTEGFTPVDGIGDAATWNAKTNTMYVFERGAMFELVVELGDSSRNLQVARAIAGQLLEMALKRCD